MYFSIYHTSTQNGQETMPVSAARLLLMVLSLLLVLSINSLLSLAKSLAGAGASFCALQVDGQAYCFGSNYFGNLGINSRVDALLPVQMLNVDRASDVSAGRSQTCIVEHDTGVAKCTGRGLLGTGDTESSLVLTPTSLKPDATNATQVFVSFYHSCVLQAGKAVLCWGSNVFGALGDGTKQTKLVPTLVPGSERAREVALGGQHTCVLSQVGKVLCTGWNAHGQLGDGTQEDSTTLRPIVGLDTIATFASVSCGHAHSCAVSGGGRVFCWGDNSKGQLGQPWPTVQSSVSGMLVVGSGLDHTHTVWSGPYSTYCILRANRTLAAFGFNPRGGFGGGSTGNLSQPVFALTLLNGVGSNIVDVRGGDSATCVSLYVVPGGGSNNAMRVVCVGSDAYGQLGSNAVDGSGGSVANFVTVSGLPILVSTRSPTQVATPSPTESSSSVRATTSYARVLLLVVGSAAVWLS